MVLWNLRKWILIYHSSPDVDYALAILVDLTVVVALEVLDADAGVVDVLRADDADEHQRRDRCFYHLDQYLKESNSLL